MLKKTLFFIFVIIILIIMFAEKSLPPEMDYRAKALAIITKLNSELNTSNFNRIKELAENNKELYGMQLYSCEADEHISHGQLKLYFNNNEIAFRALRWVVAIELYGGDTMLLMSDNSYMTVDCATTKIVENSNVSCYMICPVKK